MMDHEEKIKMQLIQQRENEDVLMRYCKALDEVDRGEPLIKALENNGLVLL